MDKCISGDWKIDKYEYSNFQGFSTEFESSGQFIISTISESQGNYSIDLSYSDGTNQFIKSEHGVIIIGPQGETYMLNRTNPDGSYSLLDLGNILFLNKSQLETTFIDESGLHHYILSK
ncbi:MAG: hypothetical protein QNK85_04880 [Crocinitomicaceae bacterium]